MGSHSLGVTTDHTDGKGLTERRVVVKVVLRGEWEPGRGSLVAALNWVLLKNSRHN